MRDDATRAEVDGLLWQFDDATDPRVGPRAWTRRNGVITPTREWHARINGREPLLAAGLTAGAPDASMPMNYVSAKAAEAIAAAMGCRLPTQREWESVAGVASDAEQNRIDLQLLEQEAFAKRTGVRAARPAADTAWADGEGAADVPARDGALWLWPAEKGTQKARFANLGGNVAEWVNTPVGPVIIGMSALTLHDGSAVRNTSSDALRGFADVGFRLAFDVAKDLPTTDAITELRSKGRQ
jgi:formylglycine-generating enzyme required for sulfatase activity